MSVSLNLITKRTNSTIATGQCIGLLLALTYAADVQTGLVVTLINKS